MERSRGCGRGACLHWLNLPYQFLIAYTAQHGSGLLLEQERIPWTTAEPTLRAALDTTAIALTDTRSHTPEKSQY